MPMASLGEMSCRERTSVPAPQDSEHEDQDDQSENTHSVLFTTHSTVTAHHVQQQGP